MVRTNCQFYLKLFKLFKPVENDPIILVLHLALKQINFNGFRIVARKEGGTKVSETTFSYRLT